MSAGVSNQPVNKEDISVAKTKKTVAKKTKPAATKKKTERRSKKSDGRRASEDRRQEDVPVAAEKRVSERRKVQRRRQIDPTTCERDYTEVEVEFMQAMDEYKRANGRMFPTCSEILEVLRDLGYQKVSNHASASNSPVGSMIADSNIATDSEEPALESFDYSAAEMEI